MTTYGQFCPVAKAVELLDERWTVLVIRELLAGSKYFNEIRRGVPKMSPALLSKRLRTLTRAGVIERRTEGNRQAYVLTTAGQELQPVVEAIGTWGARWISELGDHDLDPHLLMWDMHRSMDMTQLPESRVTMRFAFSGLPAADRHWWIVATRDDVDLCDFDPGFGDDVVVSTNLRSLTDVWRGERTWTEAMRAGDVDIDAPSRLRRQVPRWFGQSAFAEVPRPRPDSPRARSVLRSA